MEISRLGTKVVYKVDDNAENADHEFQLNQDVNVEGFIVVRTNTIVYPWAMVIKSIDTNITFVTVPASFCSYNLTIRTQKLWIIFNKQY